MRLMLTMLALAAALFILPGVFPAYADGQTQAIAPEKRLSAEIMRAAITAASTAPLTSGALDLAVTLGNEAVALNPDSPEVWRMVLHLAGLAEDEDLQARAVERLVLLDPGDENVRLQRLNLALNRYQTVAERVAAYESLLSDENIPRVGAASASRLAMDLALLKQREGDPDAFSRWLAKALELDRSNRTAAAIATGFYRANVSDAAGEAELLVNLFLADPTDMATQLDLAQLLLDHGAYRGAFRMYALAAGGLTANKMTPSNNLMADFAIAQWAQGDAEGALITIDRRQMEIDEVFRQTKAQADAQLTRADLAKLKGPVHPMLAAVAAVIKAGRGDRDAPEALNAAIASYEAEIERQKAATPAPDSAALAAEHLEIAWIALWLGSDSAKPMSLVAAAEQLQPLSDDARSRFDGWKALKDGEVDRAVEVLTPLAAKDPASAVGLAIALQQAGRNKDAARELLALNKAQPGSMIGIWAANELARILGQRVPLSEHATAMERLIASISLTVDRSVREGSMVVGVRVTPENLNPGPYDPIPLRIDITNNSTLALAIDPSGPIRPQVFVVPTINTATPLGVQPEPFIVDLDARLRLLPRETTSVTVDIRGQRVGDLLNTIAVTGGLLKIVAYSNFVASASGSIMPGLYGVEVQAPMVRIDGVRKDEQWLEQAIAMMNDPNAAPDVLVVRMALVANELQHAVVQKVGTAEEGQMLETAETSLPGAFARLDPVSQAWFLCVLPSTLNKEAILAMARKSESREVRLAYLMFHAADGDDPMLDAARRGDDPALRLLAETISDAFAARAAAASRPTGGAPVSQPAGSAPASTRPAPH